MNEMSVEENVRAARHSLYWHGDLRELPELPDKETIESAKEYERYWFGMDEETDKKDEAP